MNTIELRRAVRTALLCAAAAAAVPAWAQEAPPAGAAPGAAVEAPADQAAETSDAEQSSALAPAVEGEETLGEVIVVARQRTAAETVLQERIDQDVVVDLVSAEQIGRVGDTTVSLALRRLPGVTLVGDQFVYIRGLGERYSSTTLNGANVPSPDLTRNVIPLDLFPANIVQSLSIQKGFSPDQRAAFGGGNVDIRTRTIPDAFVFDLQIGSGWNTESGDDGLTYRGGGDDRLGTDDGTRALPQPIRDGLAAFRGNVRTNNILQTLLQRDPGTTPLEAQLVNRDLALSLNRDVDTQVKSLPPDGSGEVTIGQSWFLGEDQNVRVGFLGLGEYSHQWRNRTRVFRSFSAPDIDVDTTSRTTEQAVVTGSLALGFDFAEEQTIGATLLYLRNTEDDASITTGFDINNFRPESGNRLRNYLLRFEERALQVVQFTGAHTVGAATRALLEGRGHGWLPLGLLEGTRLNWYWSNSRAATDLPNEVAVQGQDRINPQTGELLSTAVRIGNTADFRFSELDDEVTSTGWRLTRAFEFGNNQLEVSGGQDYYEKGRAYRELRLGLGTSIAGPWLNGTPGQVFSDARLGNVAHGFELQPGGIAEPYLAAETIDAGWLNLDLRLGDTWRLSGGVRYEDFQRISLPVDPLEFGSSLRKIGLSDDLLLPGRRAELDAALRSFVTEDDDFYPALSVTWIRPDFWAENFQLRFGWSQTIARPDLREVADAAFIDPITEARVFGNPQLRTSELQNFDLRGEWFFDNGDNFTVSLFYKDIKDPIETVEIPGTEDNLSLRFINAQSAEVYGVEFETLKSLGFLSDGGWSEAFFVQGNLTVSDSNLRVGPGTDLTNAERRLVQHSPYVANLQLGWDAPGGEHTATLGYSYFAERLYFAGRSGQPDAKEQPFHSLDLTYSWFPIEPLTIKLRAQNLLNENTEIGQGDVTRVEQTIGTSFKADLTWRF